MMQVFEGELLERVNRLNLEYPEWIIGATSDDVGLGVPKFWLLPIDHPLVLAAVIHDFEYEVKIECTSKEADLRFKRNALKLSNGDLILKTKTYLFYYIVRFWGINNWHKPKSKSFFRDQIEI